MYLTVALEIFNVQLCALRGCVFSGLVWSCCMEGEKRCLDNCIGKMAVGLTAALSEAPVEVSDAKITMLSSSC